jgi:HD-like signal output (HDOD) protein
VSEEKDLDKRVEAEQDDGPRIAGPLGSQFPAETSVWREARRLVGDKNSRVDALATIAIQDPVLVIELLRRSNALYFSGGGKAITAVKVAIVRLGSDVVLETLEKIKDREEFESPEVKRWFEVYRSKCRRSGIISRLFSESIARTLADDAQAIGTLNYVGDMLAVYHFREEYVKLANEQSRSGVNYRLGQNMRFDVEHMGSSYLKRWGIPEALAFALDREGRTREQERAILKPICQSAMELIEAFDNNRWEKIAPGKTLPPKSALRMLQLSDSQYLKIYERAAEFLFSCKMMESQGGLAFAAESADNSLSTEDTGQHKVETEINIGDELESEIESLLDGGDFETTEIVELQTDLGNNLNDFSLAERPEREVRAPDVQKRIEPPKLRTPNGTQFVAKISEMFEEADNSEDLLAGLLQMLVDGPFQKSALIVVSKDRKQAMVVAARGPNIGNGQKIELKDPLSPLAQCFSKVQSFASRANEASPFGSKAFALSPIDADHDTPVALYADCGENGALTFEARRVFRNVVEILNQKLPTIPGGIPVEL